MLRQQYAAIEIFSRNAEKAVGFICLFRRFAVAPCVGARIEIQPNHMLRGIFRQSPPCVGAWIETPKPLKEKSRTKSPPCVEAGLAFLVVETAQSGFSIGTGLHSRQGVLPVFTAVSYNSEPFISFAASIVLQVGL